MKNIIKKILKEDFEWANDIPKLEHGDLFDEDDISFEENSTYEVNIIDDKIVYNMSYRDFSDKVLDGYDDWILNVLLTTNSFNDGYDTDLDEDELNYIDVYLTEEIRVKFGVLLNRLGVEDVDDLLAKAWDAEFRLLEEHLGTELYRGHYDWDDMSSDILYEIGSTIERNRWIHVRAEYERALEDNNITIDTEYYSGDLIITTPYPPKFKDTDMQITDISELLEYIGDDVLGGEWHDTYTEEWNTEGVEVEVQSTMMNFLDRIEEHIDEMEE